MIFHVGEEKWGLKQWCFGQKSRSEANVRDLGCFSLPMVLSGCCQRQTESPALEADALGGRSSNIAIHRNETLLPSCAPGFCLLFTSCQIWTLPWDSDWGLSCPLELCHLIPTGPLAPPTLATWTPSWCSAPLLAASQASLLATFCSPRAGNHKRWELWLSDAMSPRWPRVLSLWNADCWIFNLAAAPTAAAVVIWTILMREVLIKKSVLSVSQQVRKKKSQFLQLS